jgi:PTH1 family peptidyl-tRNA hydrolase
VFESGYGDYIYAKDNNIIFAKPTTLMNHSGVAIKDLCNHYNQSELIVVYDDIDLSLGSIRFKESGGTGGHKGIESIIYQLETEDFHRLKIGIALNDISMRPSEHYVLKPFPKKYKEDVETMIIRAVDALEFYFQNSIVETMNKYN